MKTVKSLYLNYPESKDGIKEWSMKVDGIFAELRNRFRPYVPPGLMERTNKAFQTTG